MGVGLAGAARGHPGILPWLFFFAWYPLILFLDGLRFCLQGDSWLLDRPRALFRMGFWSVSVWLVFEALNLVLKNWAYAGVLANPWLRWPGYALAFATVLPGILLTAEVMRALGAWRGGRGRPVRLAWDWEPWAMLLGTVCLVLPLIWPRYFFPLVWGAFFFLLDPFCRLLGGRSLIQNFLDGERREHLCLLAAGLGCGLWWEAWNYRPRPNGSIPCRSSTFPRSSRCRSWATWGLPPLLWRPRSCINFLSVLDERVLVTSRRCRYAVAVQLFFWIIMFAAIDARTVISFQ